METITTYIEHMFRGLPRTENVLRAQSDLEQMCLDRFHELRAQGLGENEAVGQVISQFGNLDDVADELGISSEVHRANPDQPRFIPRAEADKYLRVSGFVSRLVACGIAVIFASLIAFFLIGNLAEGGLDGIDEGDPQGMLAIIVMLLGIAVSVIFFVLAGVKYERFEPLEENGVALAPQDRREFSELREREGTRFALMIGGGVLVCLLGVCSLLLLGIMRGAEDVLAISSLFVFLAVGVAMLVIAGMRRGALSVLASEGDYTPERRAQAKRLQGIAGAYWCVVVAVFLVWGLGFNGWRQAWIVWPVAGVIWGAIAAFAESSSSGKKSAER